MLSSTDADSSSPCTSFGGGGSEGPSCLARIARKNDSFTIWNSCPNCKWRRAARRVVLRNWRVSGAVSTRGAVKAVGRKWGAGESQAEERPPHSTEPTDLNGDRGSLLQAQMRLAANSSSCGRPLSYALCAAIRPTLKSVGRKRTPPRTIFNQERTPHYFPYFADMDFGLVGRGGRKEGSSGPTDRQSRACYMCPFFLALSRLPRLYVTRVSRAPFLPPSVVVRCEFKWRFSPPTPRRAGSLPSYRSLTNVAEVKRSEVN